MTTQPLASPVSLALAASFIPEEWQADVEKKLFPGENVLSGVAVDLDTRLRFRKGVLVVTDRRLLALSPGDTVWQEWPYREGLELHHHDHAGVGHLELTDAHGLLAAWRFTLGENLQAIRAQGTFREQRDSTVLGHAVAAPEAITCPSCKGPLEADDEECPVCTKVLYTPPSTWTLFRLWRFAHPYRGQLLLGFLLMLGSTAAHMIPPYLIQPLTDNVLIPYQTGKQIDPHLVMMYMGGLLASAMLAWILGWGRTYVLALVAERMGADLRAETYEHLLKLSLEYFGGKRTGDLMSRIGSGSDRICVFLSLHLLDFASDVLMIIMTAVILFSKNPLLAFITLAPLPFIAWMIHVVRDRLRTGFEKIDRVWSEVTNVLADTIPGIRVVKAFCARKARSDALSRGEPAQFGRQRQAQCRVVAIFADRVFPDGAGHSGHLVLRHLADFSGRHYRWPVVFLHRLQRPLLRPPRFDEPHRVGDAEVGVGREAHLRYSRPRLQRAGTRQSRQNRQDRRPHRTARSRFPLWQPRCQPGHLAQTSRPAKWWAWSGTAAPARARWST